MNLWNMRQVTQDMMHSARIDFWNRSSVMELFNIKLQKVFSPHLQIWVELEEELLVD